MENQTQNMNPKSFLHSKTPILLVTYLAQYQQSEWTVTVFLINSHYCWSTV